MRRKEGTHCSCLFLSLFLLVKWRQLDGRHDSLITMHCQSELRCSVQSLVSCFLRVSSATPPAVCVILVFPLSVLSALVLCVCVCVQSRVLVPLRPQSVRHLPLRLPGCQ